MAKGKSIAIATRCFASQKLATQYFKEMLNRYAIDERIPDTDHLDLVALLERHDEYDEKVGCGVDYFTVMMTEYSTRCFRIVRTDGNATDFSYLHCIRGRPPSRKQEVSHALRRVIQPDLYKARDEFFSNHADANGKVICAATGESIGRDEAHIDHRPPMTFEVIITTFLANGGLSVEDVRITTAKDEQVAPDILDYDFGQKFRLYHNQVAHLDIIKKAANLAQSSQHRLKPARIKLDGDLS